MKIKFFRALLLIPFMLLVALFSQPGDAQDDPAYLTRLPFIPYIEAPRWIGPDGGSITALAVDPQQPETVYLGTWGAGIFKTTNGGVSWAPVNQGLGNLWINSLAIDPHNSAVLYAGTYKGKLYKSTDGGANWFFSSQNIQPEAIVYAIAIDPNQSNTVFIGTRGVSTNNGPPWQGTAYKSSDGGATWKPVLTDVGGSEQQDWAYAMAVHPRNPQFVYAATHEHGVYRSTDWGEHWSPANAGINDLSGRGLVIRADGWEATLYLGVWHRSGVFKSVNNGDQWSLLRNGIGDAKIYSLSSDPSQPETVYAATFSHGILKTVNGGILWTPTGLTQDEVTWVAVHPQNGQFVYAATHGNGLVKSFDAGASWYHWQTGVQATQVNQLLVAAVPPGRLYAATYGGGMWVSEPQTSTWSPRNADLGDKHLLDLVMHPANPNLLFALTQAAGLYRCELDTPQCWVPVNTGLPVSAASSADQAGAAYPFSAYPAGHPLHDPEAWLMADTPQSAGAQGQAILSTPPLLSMAFAPSNPQIAYLGTAGAGIFKSSNGGNSWATTALTSGSADAIVVHPGDLNRVYAVTEINVITSANGGATWSDTGLTGVSAYALAIKSDGVLYAGSSNGLYRLQSGSWSHLGLAGLQVMQIGLDPANLQALYLGTTNGVYYSLDGGANWQNGPQELTGRTVLSITFDPNGKYIYYSTQTHGILQVPR